MPPSPTAKQFLGLGREVTKGTPVAVSEYIPIREIDFSRVPTPLNDQSLRGSAVDNYAQAQGVMHNEWSIEGDVFLDSVGFWLKMILGEESLSGTNPYSHGFTLLNSGDFQPMSYTMTDHYGVATRSYPGCQAGELSFSWDVDGLLSYTASGQSLLESTIATPTPSYGTLDPQPAWSATLQVAGSPRYPVSGELSLSRDVGPIHVQDGQQTPRHIWVDALSVSGSFMLLKEDDVVYNQFLTNTQPIVQLNFTQGASRSLTFLMSRVAWDDASIDRGESYFRDGMDYKALGNSTDAGASGGLSPLRATLINARSTVY